MQYITIALLWIAYCFIHSYLISISVTRYMEQHLKKGYAFYRLFYVLFSLFTLIWLINYTNPMDQKTIINYDGPWNVIRYVLMIGALLLFFRAFFFDYDCLSFFGIRQIQQFFRINKTEGSGDIKKSGLLGIVRHPMYLALIIYLWTQTFRVSDIIVNAILTAYVIIGTILEEKKLVLEFGNEYIKYKEEVPMLIPIKKHQSIQVTR